MSRAQQLVVNLRGFTRGPGHPDLQGIWRDNMRDAADELERLDAMQGPVVNIEAVDVLARMAGCVIIDVSATPDCIVVRVEPFWSVANSAKVLIKPYRYIAINGSTVEELKPGHPILAELELNRRTT